MKADLNLYQEWVTDNLAKYGPEKFILLSKAVIEFSKANTIFDKRPSFLGTNEYDNIIDLLDKDHKLLDKIVGNIELLLKFTKELLPPKYERHLFQIVNRITSNVWIHEFLLDKDWNNEAEKENYVRVALTHLFSHIEDKAIINYEDDTSPFFFVWGEIPYPSGELPKSITDHGETVRDNVYLFFLQEWNKWNNLRSDDKEVYKDNHLPVTANVHGRQRDEITTFFDLGNRFIDYTSKYFFTDVDRLWLFRMLKQLKSDEIKIGKEEYREIIFRVFYLEMQRNIFWNSTFSLQAKGFKYLYENFIKINLVERLDYLLVEKRKNKDRETSEEDLSKQAALSLLETINMSIQEEKNFNIGLEPGAIIKLINAQDHSQYYGLEYKGFSKLTTSQQQGKNIRYLNQSEFVRPYPTKPNLKSKHFGFPRLTQQNSVYYRESSSFGLISLDISNWIPSYVRNIKLNHVINFINDKRGLITDEWEILGDIQRSFRITGFDFNFVMMSNEGQQVDKIVQYDDYQVRVAQRTDTMKKVLKYAVAIGIIDKQIIKILSNGYNLKLSDEAIDGLFKEEEPLFKPITKDWYIVEKPPPDLQANNEIQPIDIIDHEMEILKEIENYISGRIYSQRTEDDNEEREVFFKIVASDLESALAMLQKTIYDNKEDLTKQFLFRLSASLAHSEIDSLLFFISQVSTEF